jgi:phage baseplate assembly protein W
MSLNADTLTFKKKQLEYYSDFLDSFAKTPIGDQLGRIVNEKSVSQALKNLIYTNLGERLFQPNVGSNVNKLLFDPNDETSLTNLQLYIETTIKNNEPRVNLLGIDIRSIIKPAEPLNKGSYIDNENYVEVTIVYNVINNPAPVNLSLILKRVR